MTVSDSWPARLRAACRTKSSVVCVGIDPRIEMLPSEFTGSGPVTHEEKATAVGDWATELLDVIADVAVVVKPQSAFFEQFGPAGFAALARTIRAAKERGLLVLLDAKRGDIGFTVEAYARALLDDEGMGADALTVNAYLGRETLAPFIARTRESGKGLYVLVKTSNPGSADLQDLNVDGTPLYEHVARMVASIGDETPVDEGGWNSVGAVVGATYPEELVRLRELMPHAPILVPGYGAQGGGAADCRGAFGSDGLGAIVSSSRGIIFAHSREPGASAHGDGGWRAAVRDAAASMRDALRAVGAGAPPA